MGQIVCYKLAAGADPKAPNFTTVERAQGMREIGKRVEKKLNNSGTKYAKRISKVIGFFIQDPGYEVRYEFYGPTGLKSLHMKQDDENMFGYDLVSWDATGDEVVEGYLEVTIRKDASDADNNHQMNITVPRRLKDTGGIFAYVSNLVTDLPDTSSNPPNDPSAADQANYLKGAITFQRCL